MKGFTVRERSKGSIAFLSCQFFSIELKKKQQAALIFDSIQLLRFRFCVHFMGLFAPSSIDAWNTLIALGRSGLTEDKRPKKQTIYVMFLDLLFSNRIKRL